MPITNLPVEIDKNLGPILKLEGVLNTGRKSQTQGTLSPSRSQKSDKSYSAISKKSFSQYSMSKKNSSPAGS